MAHRSISLILLTFGGLLVPCKHNSMLQIKAKFIIAFIHALIFLLGSFLLLASCLAVCKKKWLHSLLICPKHENTSGVDYPCSTWRVCWLYSCFVFFCFHSFYEQLEDWYKWHLSKGLKTLTSQKAICPLIHNLGYGLTGKWPYVT